MTGAVSEASAGPARPGVPRPPVTSPGPWQFPLPTVHELDNGVTLWAYHVPGQHVVSVRTVLPLPLGTEPRDREGISTLMARLLDEGTSRHSSEEFAELLERAGVAFGAGVNEVGVSVEVEVPARFLPRALDLLRLALEDPAFHAKDVQRQVRTRLAEIQQERASAPHRAIREFIGTYFAATERASRPTGGTAETVAAVTPEDLIAFHGRNITPHGATIVVAGDLDGTDLPALASATVGSWGSRASGPPPPPSDPSERAEDASRIVLVDRPGSVQSEITIGCAGPDRTVAGGWAAYPVLAFLVGGSPNARIDAVLREEKGYTYGIRSVFRPRRRGGLFLTSGSVRSDATAESLGLLLDILDGVRGGVSDAERVAGVDYIRKTAPARFATAEAIADEAAGLAMDGLPLGFTTDTLAATADLTAESLTEAYRRVVDGRWTVVVVGDASHHADALAALGRGQVTVVPA